MSVVGFSSIKISSPVAVELLEERDFSNAHKNISWNGPSQISDHWTLETKPPRLSKEGDISFESPFLNIWWNQKLDRIRIFQNIEPNKLPEKSGKEYNIAVEVVLGDLGGCELEWIAILEDQKGKGHYDFYKKIPFTWSKQGQFDVAQGVATLGGLAKDRRYAFCLQFSPTGGQLAIQSASVVASEAPAKGARRGKANADKELVVAQEKNVPPYAEARSKISADMRGADRPKAAVIAWDMGHNPVGRAFLLADMLRKTHDVELVGPLFKRYGGKLWPPIANSDIPQRTFPAENMQDFIENAIEFVQGIDIDVAIICKARFPSMFLGMLLKYKLNIPVIIDVDDHELSFFKEREPLYLDDLSGQKLDDSDLNLPFGETWTRICEPLVSDFDGLMVSNIALQDKFGGVVVRHARDENHFYRDEMVRGRIRKEFGYKDTDRVILFLGTPREHKGIFEIAAAVEAIEDPNIVLCVIGSPNDKRVEAKLNSFKKARLELFPDQPWERLQDIVNMADLVCLLQNPKSPVSEYQIPAKLTDALSVGVPVAVTDVAPFEDIPSPRIISKIADELQLQQFIRRIFKRSPDDISSYARRARAYFEGELSYAVNRARMESVEERAKAKPHDWPDGWRKLFNVLSQRYGVSLPTSHPSWWNEDKAAPSIRKNRPIDIAFFWKQNDSGIYGRRHDMLVKHLARHPRIGRIVQFDTPVTPEELHKKVRFDHMAKLDQGNLVVSRVLSRHLRLDDEGNIIRRVFIHGGRPNEKLLGIELPNRDQYIDWVDRTLSEIAPKQSFLGWVAPVVFDYPALHDAMDFRFSVADLIDDQRAMSTSDAFKQRLSDSYSSTLARVDIAFANCEAARSSFMDLHGSISVVPNAAEILPRSPEEQKPYELAKLDGPVIGYVGNLRDRLDVELVARLSEENLSWNIVMIGSAHGNPPVLSLHGRANVHFLGVKCYEDAVRYIRHFDVAIMPHLDNEVSRRMNPLKLYVYAASGVPTVSTAVQNIEEAAEFAHVEPSHEAFVRRVDDIISHPDKYRRKSDFVLPSSITWTERVNAMISAIDSNL